VTASEDSPTTELSALRPPSTPRSIVLDVRSPVAHAAVPALCERVRVLLAAGVVEVITCEVGGLTHPDPGAVDALARLQLTARRLGRSIRLRHPRRELRDLLGLTGLCTALPCDAGLRLEPQWQPEGREQVRVDEEVDPADPAA
jgi:ABC-type transporter Mla MlaB component